MGTIRLQKFTNREIEKLPLPDKITYVYPDEKRPNLGVTITKSGNRSFHVRATINGASKRISIPGGDLSLMTVSEARKVAPDVISAALKGDTPSERRRQDKARKVAEEQSQVTVRNLLSDYLKAQQAKLDKPMKDSTVYDYKKKLHKEFDENVLISEVTSEYIEDLIAKRGMACMSAMRSLKAVFNYAIEEGYTTENPVPKKLARYKRRKAYLKEAYIPAWWEAVHNLKDDARDYYVFLITTGVRSDAEAGALKWEHIDWKSQSFKLYDTKNHSDIELPLPAYVGGLLEQRKKKKGAVFSGAYRDERDLVGDQIEYPFTRHDLRRTFGTIAESIDVSWLAVKRLMNHQSQESDITASYIVPSLERLRKASKLIEAEILRLAGNGQ